MARKFPKSVRLDADEAARAQRVHMAKWLGVTPAVIDAMPLEDYQDVLEVMWVQEQK